MTVPLSRETAIQNRLDAATSGPWEAWLDDDGTYNIAAANSDSAHAFASTDEDADLIANAPADLAYLLAENEKLQARIDKALAAVSTSGFMDWRENIRAALTNEGKQDD